MTLYILARDGQFDLTLRTAIRSAIDLGATHEIQIVGRQLSARSVDPAIDREYLEQGESRYYYLHVSGCSVGTLKRIAAILKGSR